MKEIVFLNQQMQVFGKEVEQVGKIAKGEDTLGQHIYMILEVIENVEEVKNLIHKKPQLKAKHKVLDKAISATQGKMSKMEAKLGNLEKLFKQMANNVGNLLKLLEHEKG